MKKKKQIPVKKSKTIDFPIASIAVDHEIAQIPDTGGFTVCQVLFGGKLTLTPKMKINLSRIDYLIIGDCRFVKCPL